MSAFFWIIAVFGLFFYAFIRFMEKMTNEEEEQEDHFREFVYSLPYSFTETHIISDYDDQRALCLDYAQKKLVICTKYGYEPFRHRAIDFINLISSRVIQEDETIVDKPHTLERAAVGGMLAGDKGAAFMAMTGKTKRRQLIKRVVLEVIVNDLNASRYQIVFFEDNKGVENRNNSYQKAKKDANHWHHLIGALIQNSQGYSPD
ncbi:hypothetical protein [Sporolactobacillus sp. KGMB 08714]|uniref:hypothetical protein n=1 Tax=Sporolactobacillus sp. KGMB 08714 TaxID=3064704 RepID=UPI002FBEAC19